MPDTEILDNEDNFTILPEDQLKDLLGLDSDTNAELFPELFPTRIMHDGNGTEQQGDPPRTFVLD